MNDFIIESGLNDQLISQDGKSYIDFLSGYGSVIVGHSNEAVNQALKSQIDKLWISGKYQHSQREQTFEQIQSFLTKNYFVSELYSTGMEAIEFSLRVTAIKTAKNSFAGFSGSMHGKSLATSSLSWANSFGLFHFHRLPFIDSLSEPEILKQIENLFQLKKIAAFYVEPIQGSAGGHQASVSFYQTLVELCKAHDVMSVFDEILTGFFRAGEASFCLANEIKPDILIFGKSIGNGFPVSAVVLSQSIDVSPNMLPKSTYSSNPLACAVVSATLVEVSRLNVREKVQQIHTQVYEQLNTLTKLNFNIRGMGALWTIEPPEHIDLITLGQRILELGVVTSVTDKYIRLLPTATITESALANGLEKVVTACRAIH